MHYNVLQGQSSEKRIESKNGMAAGPGAALPRATTTQGIMIMIVA